jgi:hypothetical protein
MYSLATECPVEEGGHLAASDIPVGAELVVDGWVAASGNSSGAEPVDVVFEDRLVVVAE